MTVQRNGAWNERVMKARLGLVLYVIWLGAAGVARAQAVSKDDGPPAPHHERLLHLPGAGEEPPVLEVTRFTPDGPGSFPLAVLNHGSIDVGQSTFDMPRVSNSLVTYCVLLARLRRSRLSALRGWG
jgi:hypothetical protein